MMNEKYQKTLDYMNKIINEDKLSHAFLIECRNVPMYMNLIFPFIKKNSPSRHGETGMLPTLALMCRRNIRKEK